jgi:hypothetical protein
MSCNRLYGGQKKNKQQSKQASLRKRSGGKVDGEDEVEGNGDGPVKVEDEVKPTDSSSVVAGVVEATEKAVEAVAASTGENQVVPDSTKSAPDAASTGAALAADASTEENPVAPAPAATAAPAPTSILSIFGFGNGKQGGKRRTQRKQRKQRKTQKAGGQKTVIGRIYSKTCVHCVAMQDEWKKLQKMLKQSGGNILMKDMEARQMDQQLPQVNKQFLGGSDQRVALQGGFPTLFKIKNKKVEYYGGERTADAMFNWALQ